MPRSDCRSSRVAGLSRAMRCALYLRARELSGGGCTCAWCGRPLVLRAPIWEPDAATVDHVRPLALGGATCPANLVAACATCNTGKNATPRELTERVAAELSHEVDMASGRLLARCLYPRPGKVAMELPAAWRDFTVYNGPRGIYSYHPRYLEALQDAQTSPD